MKKKSVIRAKMVNKRFHEPVDFHVLKDISFDVKEGEFVSIMGKSGSGKSTLLYILSTMDTDYTGDLYLNNQLVSGLDADALSAIRNEHIGFVFQFHYLLSEFSVIDNISLPARKLARKSPEEIREDAIELMRMLGIEHLAEKRASRISGGEKQRVAIARALINSPSIIMGDEPTGNLDSKNADNVLSIFRELATSRGLTLLIVTHDRDFADRTDRIITMEDGRIVSPEVEDSSDVKTTTH
jgi:lipoprotein-releasing system ATP-binding protein